MQNANLILECLLNIIETKIETKSSQDLFVFK
jgi:hypothetical protein